MMDAKKICVILLVALLVVSLGCTGTTVSDDTDGTNTGGTVVSESDTAEVDAVIDDFDSDMSEIEDLITDSEIDIEDSGIDETLI